MNVEVKLYGPISFISGRKEFDLELEGEPSQVGDFFRLLYHKFPRFRDFWQGSDLDAFLEQRILCVINEEPCIDPLRPLKDGDQIKILTPVSGG